MEKRILHGEITPAIFAQGLIAEFNHGNLRAQVLGRDEHLAVQIATQAFSRSGGQTALTVDLQRVEDGVMIQVGEQQWLGTAASLGQTAISALLNPWNLLGRLDDLAQDVQNLQITERVWQVIDRISRQAGAKKQLSERLSRLTCSYCGVANPVGEAACIACGAPLGADQPGTCPQCGFVLTRTEKFCPNCGKPV